MKSKQYLRPKSLKTLDAIGFQVVSKQASDFTGRVVVTLDFSNGTLCRAAGMDDKPEWRFPDAKS
jgi:hypothetical protein